MSNSIPLHKGESYLRNLNNLYGVISLDIIQNAEKVFHRFGTKHVDAGFLEVRNTLEHRGVGQVSAHMKDASAFVQKIDTIDDLLAEDFHFPVE